ncbi:MAG: hypothetical protein LBU35_00885 [Holosporales bacterium]|jgi:hypothetical protein|nr:hypothetical protein [Holosporales bacterium]
MNSSSETISSGTKANKTGNALESFVEAILIRNGYTEFINNKKQVFAMRQSVGGKQFSKQQLCGESIYGSARRCDFFVINQERFPKNLIIECKWQESAGSVDEKYPFVMLNITKIAILTIVLIDGKGYKKQAFKWLKDQVSTERALIDVCTMQEFQKLVNQGFLG